MRIAVAQFEPRIGEKELLVGDVEPALVEPGV
jgi:hypothetical protein